MSLWIIAAMFGALLQWTANAAMKHVASTIPNSYIGLIWQYISMTIFAIIFVVVISLFNGTPILPSLDGQALLVLLLVWFFGYIGIYFLFKAFASISGGVALIIANISVFMMYFANLAIFEWSESLPFLQILLGILFFVVIAQFLRHQSGSKKFALDIKMLYPLVTAVCWTIFFVGNTWFVKNAIMTPVQSVFATESIILVFALLGYALMHKRDFKPVRASYSHKIIVPFAIIGSANVASAFLYYYGYLDNPANIINFVRLFGVVTTTILAWIFLKDRLTQRQIVLMSVAFVLLVLFIFADNIIAIVK
jgi:drug/metabolite transporter (DMT)-like permease